MSYFVGTVLNRSASYLIVNGKVRMSAPLGANASLYRFARAKNIKLVNPESIKGLSILDELHSHAKALPARVQHPFEFANVV